MTRFISGPRGKAGNNLDVVTVVVVELQRPLFRVIAGDRCAADSRMCHLMSANTIVCMTPQQSD